MRRNIHDAIREVRASRSNADRCRMSIGHAWEVAETLADEVERLHNRLEEAEQLLSPVKRDAWHDEQVFLHVALKARRRLQMVDLENDPPRGLTAAQARVAAQRLVERGELHLDQGMSLRCGKRER